MMPKFLKEESAEGPKLHECINVRYITPYHSDRSDKSL